MLLKHLLKQIQVNKLEIFDCTVRCRDDNVWPQLWTIRL